MTRRTLLTISSALWGLATAISLTPFWTRPAPPNQLPGYATSRGFDAHTSILFMAGVVLLPLAFTFVLRPLTKRLSDDRTRNWAANGAMLAMTVALWFAIISRDVAWTFLPAALVVTTCAVLRSWRAGFSRRDLILLPTFAIVFLALVDCSDLGIEKLLLAAALLVLAARLLVAAIRRPNPLSPALCFSLAPLGIVSQTFFFSYDQRHMAWPPLLLALLSPLLIRLVVASGPATRSRLRVMLAWVIFPIFAFGYSSATSMFAAEGKSRISLFEAAHHLVPASEILRGEKLYRDIIPTHGLIHDGLLDVWLSKFGPLTAGRSMKTRTILHGLVGVAGYSIATAATSSPEAGLLAFFLGSAMGTGGSPRQLPALCALALMAAAVRRRSPRTLASAGAVVVLAGLTSIDFGVYAILVLAFAATRIRQGWRYALSGFAAAAVIGSTLLAAGGIFIDFLRCNLLEMTSLGPVYALDPFYPPEIFKTFQHLPEVLVAAVNRGGSGYVIWVLVLLFVTVRLALPPSQNNRRRAAENALLVVGLWVVILAISYAERHHLYFMPAVPAFLIAGAFYLRHRSRWATPIATVLLLMLAQPTIHAAINGSLRHSHGPMDPGMVELTEPARARGVFWNASDASWIVATGHYLPRLAPDDTFFDFTNRGGLYFLFNRDCPIRQIEPAFYETEARQRAVIAAIEHNPHVRAAIVPMAEGDHTGVDHVPNPVRAPLVWSYLQQNFVPDFQEGEIVIWRRK